MRPARASCGRRSELLIRDGYPALSVVALGRSAKLSPQTIDNSIGGTADVLKACYDVTLAGDDESVAMSEPSGFPRFGTPPIRRPS